jgi:hypothetical protein
MVSRCSAALAAAGALLLLVVALLLLVGAPAGAQLADETQIAPTVPGGQIGKSLLEQVGEGHGDEATPGSAVYLIKRDPGRSVRRGR